MRVHTVTKLLAATLLCGGLAACQGVPVVGNALSSKEPVVAQKRSAPDPTAQFAATAANGENATIQTSAGVNQRVAASRVYHAASGKRCRYLDLQSSTSQSAARVLYCETPSGEWAQTPVVVSNARAKSF